jgi:UDP-N-acetylglucosamine acyltransferase
MNYIHPTSIIDPKVILGDNNYIGPFCYITGDTIIGDNNRFEAYCSIGTPSEHRDYFNSSLGKTIIGHNNIFREFVTIHAGSISSTVLYDNITILNHSHIAHDVIIKNNTTISANVTIAGHCHIMEGTNMAMGAICHQFQIVGAYSMIGMGGIITKQSRIQPGGIYIGSPVKYLKMNTIGLERSGINDEKLNIFVEEYKSLTNEM